MVRVTGEGRGLPQLGHPGALPHHFDRQHEERVREGHAEDSPEDTQRVEVQPPRGAAGPTGRAFTPVFTAAVAVTVVPWKLHTWGPAGAR